MKILISFIYMEKPEFKELEILLEKRIATISDTQMRDENPDEQLRLLGELSGKITEWHSENKSRIPAQLNHFLKQSSLSKALDYLKHEL